MQALRLIPRDKKWQKLPADGSFAILVKIQRFRLLGEDYAIRFDGLSLLSRL